MSRWLTFGVVLLTAAPAFAQTLPPSDAHLGECRVLTRQIAHFEQVAVMAHNRGDSSWENGTLAHIDHLQARRVKLCPQYANDGGMAAFLAMLRTAGQIALKLFTMGVI